MVQDCFINWVEVIPLPDQRVTCLTRELTKFFSGYGKPEILHFDQGRKFEFERFNCSTIMHIRGHSRCLGMLRTCHYVVCIQYFCSFLNWFLTISPNIRCLPCSTPFTMSLSFDSLSYLCGKLVELRGLVDTNPAAAELHQKQDYDKHAKFPSFETGDSV